MGKIRIKTVGDPEAEKAQREQAEKRRQQKLQDKKKTTKAPGLKGGERLVAVGPSEAEILEQLKKQPAAVEEKKDKEVKKDYKKQGVKKIKVKKRSPRYLSIKALIDRHKIYELEEALGILRKTANAHFPETIEAHINIKNLKVCKSLQKKADKRLRFERKSPLAHAILGKTADKPTDWQKNLEAVVKIISADNISKITLSSTMGPGIKVKV